MIHLLTHPSILLPCIAGVALALFATWRTNRAESYQAKRPEPIPDRPRRQGPTDTNPVWTYKPWPSSAAWAGIDPNTDFFEVGIGSPKEGGWFLSSGMAFVAVFDFASAGHSGGLTLLSPISQRPVPTDTQALAAMMDRATNEAKP